MFPPYCQLGKPAPIRVSQPTLFILSIVVNASTTPTRSPSKPPPPPQARSGPVPPPYRLPCLLWLRTTRSTTLGRCLLTTSSLCPYRYRRPTTPSILHGTDASASTSSPARVHCQAISSHCNHSTNLLHLPSPSHQPRTLNPNSFGRHWSMELEEELRLSEQKSQMKSKSKA